MELVKDLTDEGIIYYWVDQSGEEMSPHLHSFSLAEEWRIRYLFSLYAGEERRASIIDRRSNLEKRKLMEKNHLSSRNNPLGRRKSDIPAAVDIDLFEEKIKEFY